MDSLSVSRPHQTAPAADRLTIVPVALGTRAYDILIGRGALDQLGHLVAPMLKLPRVHIIADAAVWPLYAPRIITALAQAGLSHQLICLPAGEATKGFGVLEQTCETLLASGLERGDLIVAVGGGTIGDLAGFCAAILLRGIGFVQVPTSLLAQVDSSVGGKTAINSQAGKNLLGAFHQPALVIADTEVLSTLPERELRAGYAEIVKYGLIDDPAFFDWCCDHGTDLLRGDSAALTHAIAVSCRNKARIVADDEKEQGQRALLNLGHTFAHALERETGFGAQLLHGEAVALGMILAFDLSVRLGLCPPADGQRVQDHFRATGLPVDMRTGAFGLDKADPADLLDHMMRDKKVSGGKMTFVLTHGIGKAFVTQEVARADVEAVLKDALS